MKHAITVAVMFLLYAGVTMAQNDLPAYRIFNATGKEVGFDTMIKDLEKPEVVFLGEMHNCPITHWLELKTVEALYKSSHGKMKVGMEMFESDNQLIINEYFGRVITSDRFENEARLWPNYSTDYAPVVSFLYDNRIPLIATNVPRRYANVVKQRGLQYLDSLSAEAKQYLPPLPITYKNNEQANGAFALMSAIGKGKGANPEFMGQAQALKDATMAWYINRNLNGKMIHINGNYHTDSGDGIITYLKQYRPKTTYKTVYSVRQDDISKLEEDYIGKADYYICVPTDMANSY